MTVTDLVPQAQLGGLSWSITGMVDAAVHSQDALFGTKTLIFQMLGVVADDAQSWEPLTTFTTLGSSGLQALTCTQEILPSD